VRRMLLLTLLPFLACTDRTVESGAGSQPVDSLLATGAADSSGPGKELIPAEWTVFEDTSRTGEVTTASLQLPAAKDIEGLLDDGARLVLRCIDGRVEASIDTEANDSLRSEADSIGLPDQRILIHLDSAPRCE
jgi:hypothetical protein